MAEVTQSVIVYKFGPYRPSNGVITIKNVRKLVHFDEQNGELFIWCEAPEGKDRYVKDLQFLIVGTGWLYDASWEHTKSVVTEDGHVWHLLQPLNMFRAFGGF